MDGFRAVLVRLHKECLKMDTNAIKKFIAEKVPQALFDKPDVRPYFIVAVPQSAVKIKMR